MVSPLILSPSQRLRVTQILDAYQEPYLIEWRVKNGKTKTDLISNEAKAIGTEVDKYIQEDIQGRVYVSENNDVRIVNCVAGWMAFKKQYPQYVGDITGIQPELFAGEIVGHADIVHKLEISDIKTGKTLEVRPKYLVQVSKYALMSGKDRAALIILSKSVPGSFSYIWWDKDMIDYFGITVFDAFKTIYEYGDMVNRVILNYMEAEAMGI